MSYPSEYEDDRPTQGTGRPASAAPRPAWDAATYGRPDDRPYSYPRPSSRDRAATGDHRYGDGVSAEPLYSSDDYSGEPFSGDSHPSDGHRGPAYSYSPRPYPGSYVPDPYPADANPPDPYPPTLRRPYPPGPYGAEPSPVSPYPPESSRLGRSRPTSIRPLGHGTRSTLDRPGSRRESAPGGTCRRRSVSVCCSPRPCWRRCSCGDRRFSGWSWSPSRSAAGSWYGRCDLRESIRLWCRWWSAVR